MDKIINIQVLNPDTFEYQKYSESDQNLILSFEGDTVFDSSKDYIEYIISDINNNIMLYDPEYNGYNIIDNKIKLFPEDNLYFYGYDEGQYITKYNILTNLLGSSYNKKYYIQNISSDRTEIRLNSTTISSNEIIKTTSEFINLKSLSNKRYIDFYLNFGMDKLLIATNILLENEDETSPTVLIKLYEPLPLEFNEKDELWIVEQLSNPTVYQIDITKIFSQEENIIKLKGPNLNLFINDIINNSTEYTNYNSLLNNISLLGTGSTKYQLENLLSQKGTNINIDYSSYLDFIHFSSAKTRLENFVLKLRLIEQYQVQGNLGSGSLDSYVSQSQNVYLNKINEIIKEFDGYEYYLYYSSGSTCWPKINSQYPYQNYVTTDSNAISWFNSQSLVAEEYDRFNKDYLLNSIPSYLTEDPNNYKMQLFVEMLGQHFDNIWLYIKDITNKYNADNRIDYGVSKDLVADVLRDFGIKIYQNNFSTNDLYSSLLGITPSGSLYNISNAYNSIPTPEGLEYINTFVTSSNTGSLFPLNDLNKRIYKRLYHNLPLLLKKKGTIDGLRLLVNSYGIPDTILRISEFGGKDKQNINDWDYWYNYYSYEFKTHQEAQPLIPWLPLLRNYYAENKVILPDTITLRFKTTGIPNSSQYSQSILVKKINNPGTEFDFGIFLNYTGSGYTSSSYSGSIPNEYKEYGNLNFVISGSNGYISSSNIYLPFFDGDWWTLMLRRNNHISSSGENNQNVNYDLFVKNKIYEGIDGYKLGFQGSSSITVSGSYNESWNNFSFYSSSYVPFGIYVGGYIGGITNLVSASNIFSGSFSEFRYYGNPLNELSFDDLVMNPKSIEGNTNIFSGSSKDIVNFRAPLGNLLETKYFSSNFPYITYESLHPAITGSCITESFWFSGSILPKSGSYYNTASYASGSIFYLYGDDGNDYFIIADSHSYFDVLYHNTGSIHSISQTEVYYVDTPSVGILTPNSNKIKDVDENNYGNVLSNLSSIQQNYIFSQSYSPDNNYLEVAFSPQNEINDDISEALGYFNIGEYIGDPRDRFNSNTSYENLDLLRNYYFCKYIKPYNLNDYIRLIKYFDNSLFKLVKDFVPSRTNLVSGLVIKPHYLERSRYKFPSVDWETLDKSGSIDTAFITGSIAGGFKEFGGETPFIRNFIPDFTQSWDSYNSTPLGLVTQSNTYQYEFYNGEFSGSNINVYTEHINPFSKIDTKENLYTITQYAGDRYRFLITKFGVNYFGIYDNILLESKFLEFETEPDSGEVYLYNIAVDNSIGTIPYVYNADQYFTKFIKISKFNSLGENNSIYLGQATKIIISFKNGTGTSNVSFGIKNISEYPTYYLYEIFTKNIINASGLGYNLNELKQEAPLLSPNIIVNDNIILNADVSVAASFGFIPANPGLFNMIPLGVPISFNISNIIDPLGWFNTSSFSYIIGKTFNTDDVQVSVQGTINSANGPSAIYLIRRKPNQTLNLLNTSISILDSGSTSIYPYSFNLSATLIDNDVPVEGEEILVAVIISPGASIKGLDITNFEIDYITPGQTNTPDLIIIEPYFSQKFNNSNYNPLINNVSDSRISKYYMDVDYSDSPTYGSSLKPINFDQIIKRIAIKAPIQDYYYNIKRHTLPRYEGTKTTSPDFNQYNEGNSGFGKETVARNPKPFIGYYNNKGGSTPEAIGKTIVNLDYIIDENIQVQVPALSDFTIYNQMQLFERDSYIYLDPDKNSIGQQFAGNQKYKIYRSGEYATPILYSQTGSIAPGFLNSLVFTDTNNPDPTSIISYSSLFPYITDITNYFIGNTFMDITFAPDFTRVYGEFYPQVPNSGYDSTIYPFEITPFEANYTTSGTPFIDVDNGYEIRFNADENLVFPILKIKINPFTDSYSLTMRVGIPSNFNPTTSLPIGSLKRQSFLIRRWIPRAGFIYLEAGDPPNGLGKGIIKPEYITKGIENKIPEIIKELTDKNLIQ